MQLESKFNLEEFFETYNRPLRQEIRLYGNPESIRLWNELCKDYYKREQFKINVQPAPPNFFRFLQSFFN